MFKVKDRILRILLPAIPCGLFFYEYIMFGKSTAQANIIYIITIVLVCESSRFLIYASRTWFKGRRQRAKRLFLLIPTGIFVTAALFVVSKGIRNYIAFGDSLMDANTGFILHFNNESIKLGLVASSALYGMMGFLLLLGVYELAYHFAKLRYTEKERDRLEKEKLQAELQQLKGIVNPHFLFNNLNSLSSLISENPSQAEDFLDELTRVFRYLLKNNEIELTTLSQELGFINSYFHLLQTRYGKGIVMSTDISKDCESCLLPPLTLQLLVENAVKHNRVHKDEPLIIEIFSNDDKKLIVRNNLMVREQRMESTGIGLKSINSRFKLLNHSPLTIKKDNGYFDVIIPLIPALNSTTILTRQKEEVIVDQTVQD